MKSVLILAHDFPPLNSIGAQRPYSWHKYLNEFNIQSTVITKNWQESNTVDPAHNKNIIRVDFSSPSENPNSGFSFFRKISTLCSIYFHHIFLSTSPKYGLYKKTSSYLTENKVDYIITSGEPFILFIYAAKLSKKFNIPWVADYRDGWSFNYHLNHHTLNRLLLKPLYKFLEKKYVPSAHLITTVSEPIRLELQKLFPKKNIQLIYNGFDPELFASPAVSGQNTELTFIYAGSVYPYQRIDVFFEAMNTFISNHPAAKVRMEFYGIDNYKDAFLRLTSLYPALKSCIYTFPRTDHKKIIERQYKSDVLLLFAGTQVDGSAAKIFEYFALNKKILLIINDHGTLQSFITTTQSGIICNDKNDAINAIQNLYNEWESTGIIHNHSINFEQFSRKIQTQKLAELLLNT